MQCAGLGPLTPNTVLMGWPWWWRRDPKRYVPEFFSTINQATLWQKTVLLYHNITDFPTNDEMLGGFIDVWWIIRCATLTPMQLGTPGSFPRVAHG